MTLANVRIIGNTASAAGGTQGGGLRVELFSDQRFELLNARIKDNVAIDTGGTFAAGGGIDLRTIGSSSFLIQGCEIDLNAVQSLSGQASGTGIRLKLIENAQAELLAK